MDTIILIDDSDQPFWAEDGRVKAAWSQALEGWDVLQVAGFRHFAEGERRVLTLLRHLDRSQGSLYVVTDARFEDEAEGGSALLRAIVGSGLKALTRGVVFSVEPVGHLPRNCERIHRVGGRDADQATLIRHFLSTGETESLAYLELAFQAAVPFIRLCEEAATYSEADRPFRKMRTYGRPANATTPAKYQLDIASWIARRSRPVFELMLGADGVIGFESVVRAAYLRGLSYSQRSSLSEAEMGLAWREVELLLHPIFSLGDPDDAREPGIVRLAWELMNTGGDVRLLTLGHPYNDLTRHVSAKRLHRRLQGLSAALAEQKDAATVRQLCASGVRQFYTVEARFAAARRGLKYFGALQRLGSKLEASRANLHHAVFRRAFLDLLRPIGDISAQSNDEKASEYALRWDETASARRKLEAAITTWSGAPGDNSLPQRLLALHREADCFREAGLRPQLPDLAPLIASVEAGLAGFQTWDLTSSENDEAALEFWTATLKLDRLLAGLQLGNTNFWEYYVVE